MLTKRIFALLLVFTFLLAGTAWAATDSKTLTINATVAATAKLTLSAATISFPNADPDTVASIPSAPTTVTFTCMVKTGAASLATLTVLATGDLTNTATPPDTIAINNVTWTTSGAPFVVGTMNKTTAQPVASWTGSGNRTGTCSYFLANSWNYATGTYTASANYVLTAP
jgi:hypothetical protein